MTANSLYGILEKNIVTMSKDADKASLVETMFERYCNNEDFSELARFCDPLDIILEREEHYENYGYSYK